MFPISSIIKRSSNSGRIWFWENRGKHFWENSSRWNMADVVRPQVRTRSRRARRVVNFSQIPQLDHVRRDLNAGAYVRRWPKREKGKAASHYALNWNSDLKRRRMRPSWISADTEKETTGGKMGEKKKRWKGRGKRKGGKTGMSGGSRLEREKENVINLAGNNKLS